MFLDNRTNVPYREPMNEKRTVPIVKNKSPLSVRLSGVKASNLEKISWSKKALNEGKKETGSAQWSIQLTIKYHGRWDIFLSNPCAGWSGLECIPWLSLRLCGPGIFFKIFRCSRDLLWSGIFRIDSGKIFFSTPIIYSLTILPKFLKKYRYSLHQRHPPQ